jgi:hypothetical protein
VRIKVVPLTVVACVALAGGCACSRDPDPHPTTVPPTTATQSPTTPPPPTLPALARADTPAGAESFARFWLIALDYAYQTGNTAQFRSLGRCKGCVSLADAIDQVYREGGRFEGGRLSVRASRTSAYSPKRSADVELGYSRTSRRTIRGDGHVFNSTGSDDLGFLVSLKWIASHWTVVAFPTIK